VSDIIPGIIPLPNYPGAISPFSDTVPFTARSGASFAEVFYGFRHHFDAIVLPALNGNVQALTDAWNENKEALQAIFNQAIIDLSAGVTEAVVGVEEDRAAADAARIAAEAARDLAEQYASDAAIAVDASVAAIASDDESALRGVLDGLYASASAVADLATLVTTGRLSEENLALLASIDYVDDAVAALNDLIDEKASLATQTTVETGRLSIASLNDRFADVNKTALAAKLGGRVFIGDQFDKMRAGLITPASNTRVVVLGDSHAGDGVGPNLSVVPRLAFRAGASSVPPLSDVVGPIVATGMRWWNGSSGGAGIANYLTAPKIVQIGNVQPDYVIHIIGANDFAGQTPIVDYKNYLRDWSAQIEAGSPGAVNVYVHTHGSPAPAVPTIGWNAYGVAMAEVAAELPVKRVYINADDVLGVLGLYGSQNRTDLKIPTPDLVHLNGHGARLLADIIGGYMGIPSETDFGSVPRVAAFPAFVGSPLNDYLLITGLYLPPVNYTRSVDIAGKLYTAFSHVNDEVHIQHFTEEAAVTLLGRKRFRATRVGAVDVTLSANFTILPFQGAYFRLLAAPNTVNGGQPITPVADVNYSYLNATLNAL